ncbi:MAG: hypothetical protein C4532_13195, partial [Candidatus Abyssobacteria bacterium SURF_17]
MRTIGERNDTGEGRQTSARLRLAADWYFIAAVLLSVLWCLAFSKVDLSFFAPYFFTDMGHQLCNFEGAFHGEILYRDFWENWAPGTFYLNALAFKIFCVSIYSTKLLLAIVTAGSAVLLYMVSRHVVPRPVALAITAISLLWGNSTLNVPYSGWFSNCFGLVALWAFAGYVTGERHRLTRLAFSGLALGLSFSCKQNVGSLGLLAISTAAALQAQINERNGRPEVSPASSGSRIFFSFLILLSLLVLVFVSGVVLPMSLWNTLYMADLRPAAQEFIVFFLPVWVLNCFVLVWGVRLTVRRPRGADLAALFREMAQAEVALAAGFAIVVAPWFIYFSR